MFLFSANSFYCFQKLHVCSVVSHSLWPHGLIACQVPPSREFSRQEYWSGLPFPTPGDLLFRGLKPRSHISCIGRQILYHRATWEVHPKTRALKNVSRAFLVVQWLRVYQPMQGTRVWVLVQEDAICHKAAKPRHRNHWSPWTLEPMLHHKRSHCNEKPKHQESSPTHSN